MDINPGLQKAVELAIRARQLADNNQQQEAISLFDEAIAIVEEADLPSYQFQIQRQLMRIGRSPDHSSLIPILEEAVDYFEQDGNVLEKVDALLNLSGILSRLQKYPQALDYLDKAHSAINGLRPSQLKKLDEQSPNTRRPPSTLLNLRHNEISRRRMLIKNALNHI